MSREVLRAVEGELVVRISYSTEARDLEMLVKKAGEVDFSIPIHRDPSASDQQSFEKIVLLCSSKKIPFRAVPGISSVNVAPARGAWTSLDLYSCLSTEAAR